MLRVESIGEYFQAAEVVGHPISRCYGVHYGDLAGAVHDLHNHMQSDQVKLGRRQDDMTWRHSRGFLVETAV